MLNLNLANKYYKVNVSVKALFTYKDGDFTFIETQNKKTKG